jgi:tetratricopeptide (TPR) repeat protein
VSRVLRDANDAPDAPASHPWLRVPWVLAALLLATAALYAPSLSGGFPFDDQFVAKAEYGPGRPNPMVSQLRPVPEYFRSHYWRGWSETGVEYRPVTILSYALTYRLAGRHTAETSLGEALPQRVVNLLLHLACVLLVYALLRELSGSARAALAGALVFAVHAVHSEAVAAIVGRAELLGFALGCAASLLALRAVRSRGRALGVLSLLSAGIFFLAFCSKESALAWPGLLAVSLFARGDASKPAALRLVQGLGFAALVSALPALVFLGLRASALAALPEAPPPDPMVNPLAHVPDAARWLTAIRVLGHGLWLTLFPFRLVCDYGLAVFPILNSPFDPRFLASAAALLALLGGGLRLGWRHPLLLAGAACFLGFAFLTSNLVVVIGTIFGERLLYAPSLALCFAVAWAVQHAPERPSARFAAACLLALWVGLSALVTGQRAVVWRDNETLYARDLVAQPRSARLHYLASDRALLRGDRAGQFRHLEAAFHLKPEVPRAWLRLAWFFQRQGRSQEAMRALARGSAAAQMRAPRYLFHLHWTQLELESPESPEQGAVLAAAQQATRALLASPADRAALREALTDNAPAVRTWLVAADHLARSGELGLARRALQEGIVALAPASEDHRFGLLWNLTGVLDAGGDRVGAADALASALEADPSAWRQRLDQVYTLQTRGWDATRLASLFERGARLEPDQAVWTLYAGLAHARGQPERAQALLQRALGEIPEHPRRDEAARVLAGLRPPPKGSSTSRSKVS